MPLPTTDGHSLLAHGLGRSYGDVALNAGGTLLMTRGMDRLICFDPVNGVLRAEAGVSLAEVIDLVTPAGWSLPVVPGTSFVTLGGAVANDIHGKNHHLAGSFGRHVRALGLLRSDRQAITCGPTEASDWFSATVGGIGLTGLIRWVELQLASGPVRTFNVEHKRFDSLDAYWDIDVACRAEHSHTVAWIDALNGGRGIYSAGSVAPQQSREHAPRRHPRATMPALPFGLINPLSRRLFNAAYFHRALSPQTEVQAADFLFPLDSIAHWNRVYGSRGFFQYQCVLPPHTMQDGLRALFARMARQRMGSALTVLKTFGEQASVGLLSFARPGTTLAMDFEHRGAATLRQLDELDAIVQEAGGALYPAKDARMTAAMFRHGYPRLDEFLPFVDPGFSSDFWRRVGP